MYIYILHQSRRQLILSIHYYVIYREFMRARSKVVKELDGGWTTSHLQSSPQTDGHSCGPFVMVVSIEDFNFLNKQIWSTYVVHFPACNVNIKSSVGRSLWIHTKSCRWVVSVLRLVCNKVRFRQRRPPPIFQLWIACSPHSIVCYTLSTKQHGSRFHFLSLIWYHPATSRSPDIPGSLLQVGNSDALDGRCKLHWLICDPNRPIHQGIVPFKLRTLLIVSGSMRLATHWMKITLNIEDTTFWKDFSLYRSFRNMNFFVGNAANPQTKTAFQNLTVSSAARVVHYPTFIVNDLDYHWNYSHN